MRFLVAILFLTLCATAFGQGVNSVRRFQEWGASESFQSPTGSVSAPALSSARWPTTGTYYDTTFEGIRFSVAGTVRTLIDSSGPSIGTRLRLGSSATSPTVELYVPRAGSVAVTNTGTLVGATLGGTLVVSNNPIATAGASRTNLITYSVKANTLTNLKDRLKFRASGRFADNANAKEIFVGWGSEDILDTTAQVVNGGAWTIEGEIVRDGNTSQSASADFHGAGVLLFTTAAAVSLAQTNGIATTLYVAADGVSDGDVTNRTLTVEYWPAP